MWICLKCHSDNLERSLVCGNCEDGRSDSDGAALITADMVEEGSSSEKQSKTVKGIVYRPLYEPKPACVPRRFGINTMLVVTFMFGLLFSFLKICNAPWQVYLYITLYLFGAGLGQMFLFHGRSPRVASFIVGMIMGPIIISIIEVADAINNPQFTPELITYKLKDALMIYFCGGLFFCGIVGYFAGVCVSSIFLVCERKEQAEEEKEVREREFANLKKGINFLKQSNKSEG